MWCAYTHKHTYTHNGILVIKRNEIWALCNMNVSRRYNAKWNKSEMISLIFGNQNEQEKEKTNF